jgi:hypothetical protein
MHLSKKTRQKLWQIHGGLTVLEYPHKPNFDEIILRAAENFYDLIKDDVDKESFRVLGFHVKIEEKANI